MSTQLTKCRSQSRTLQPRDALLVLGHHLGRALLQRLDAVPLHGAAGGDNLVLLSLERLDHEHRAVETLAPALLLVYTQQCFSLLELLFFILTEKLLLTYPPQCHYILQHKIC